MGWSHYIRRKSPPTIQEDSPGAQFNKLIEELHDKVICEVDGDGEYITATPAGPNKVRLTFNPQRTSGASDDNDPPTEGEEGGGGGGGGESGGGGSGESGYREISIEIGTVTTLPAGAQATADLEGGPNYVLNLGIPQGERGEGTDENAGWSVHRVSGGAVSMVGGQSRVNYGTPTVHNGNVYPYSSPFYIYMTCDDEGTRTISTASSLPSSGRYVAIARVTSSAITCYTLGQTIDFVLFSDCS